MRVFLYHEFWKKEEEENQTGSEGKGEEGLGRNEKIRIFFQVMDR